MSEELLQNWRKHLYLVGASGHSVLALCCHGFYQIFEAVQERLMDNFVENYL